MGIINADQTTSRDGKVFFVAELLGASNGARWWRHRRDTSASGQPFTPSYKTEAEAKWAVENLEKADALAQATEILVAEGVTTPEQDILARAYSLAASGGVPVHPGTVSDTYLEFRAWAQATLRLLREEGSDRQPSTFEMAMAFFSNGIRSPAAMLDAWREADRRWQKIQERMRAIDTVKRILEETGEAFVYESKLTKLLELQAAGCEETPRPDELVAGYRNLRAVVQEVRGMLEAEGFAAVPDSGRMEDTYLAGRITSESLADYWRAVLESERLQAQKEAERRERRRREDELIRSMASAFAADRGLTSPRRADLELVGTSAPGGRWPSKNPKDVLDRIYEALVDQPWLRHLIVQEGEWPNLFVSDDGLRWQQDNRILPVAARYEIARVSSLADAYGPVVDWAKPWHVIRPKLLTYIKDKELDLLHRADVLAALGRAREMGKELVVFGNVAYQWIDGEWRLREVVRRDRSGRGQGATLWLTGPIVSRNYGRIIILPFIKSDGTEVNGYTRNSPYEGEAPPRAEPRVIPFEVYARNSRDDTWVHSGEVVVPHSETVALR